MPLSTARVATSSPELHLKQADAAGHDRATIAFDQGTCTLIATTDELLLIAAAADAAALTGVQDAVARKLATGVDWSTPITGDEVQIVDPAIEDYLLAHSTPADDLLRELAVTTREATGRAAGMQVSADEGALLSMLVRLSGARRAIEVGVFTGYSSLCIARALPADGQLIACDVSSEWTAIARPFWERAGVADRVDLRIGPALDTLRALPAEPAFDFAFIDADKGNYPAYYEEIVPRLVPGGLLVLDNVFQGGRVLDPAFQEANHVAMRHVNEAIVRDDRLDCVMLPVRDGVTLARKR